MSKEYTIRVMTLEDYDEVYALWMGIHGFGIRSIDDSKEGVERFLKRNPTTSMVAVADGKIVGAILCGHDADVCIMSVCMKITGRTESEKPWQSPVCAPCRKKKSIRSA